MLSPNSIQRYNIAQSYGLIIFGMPSSRAQHSQLRIDILIIISMSHVLIPEHNRPNRKNLITLAAV
jgi:hypothetical protein